MKKLIWLASFITCFSPLSIASDLDVDAISADEVASCMRANLPNKTSSQEVTLLSHDRAGGKREIDGRLFWNNSEEVTATMLKIEGPRDLAGGTYLSLKKPTGDELYMYVPALNKVRRISGKTKSGQILGTDISYQDLAYLQGLSNSNTVTVYGADTTANRPTWKLEIVPNEAADGGYTRVEAWVDQETCVSLQVDFFESETKLAKRLVGNVVSLTEVDSRWLLKEQTMTDLDEDTSTKVTIHKIAYDPRISRQHFHKKRFFQAP